MSAIAAGRRFDLSFMGSLPMPVWLLLATLVIGLGGSATTEVVMQELNLGFGRALGDYALILIPSFVIAEALAAQPLHAPSTFAPSLAPLTAAGMMCPDTAYASLQGFARGSHLRTAFGSLAGFKLLFPAGPLIVATGLGLHSASVYWLALALFFPVFLTGWIWGALFEESDSSSSPVLRSSSIQAFLIPLGVLFGILVIGLAPAAHNLPRGEWLFSPKGALLVAAAVALVRIERVSRKKCVEVAVRRTAGLLLMIGCASAFGTLASKVLIANGSWISQTSSVAAAASIFVIAALFKTIKGSSMATFTAVTSLIAPLISKTALSSDAAVLAVCAGSFVAVLPNDSFYWLVKQPSHDSQAERRQVWILAIGSTLQGLAGLAVLLALISIRFV